MHVGCGGGGWRKGGRGGRGEEEVGAVPQEFTTVLRKGGGVGGGGGGCTPRIHNSFATDKAAGDLIPQMQALNLYKIENKFI